MVHRKDPSQGLSVKTDITLSNHWVYKDCSQWLAVSSDKTLLNIIHLFRLFFSSSVSVNSRHTITFNFGQIPSGKV